MRRQLGLPGVFSLSPCFRYFVLSADNKSYGGQQSKSLSLRSVRCSPEAGLFGTATLTKTGQRESQRRKNPLHVQLLGIFFARRMICLVLLLASLAFPSLLFTAFCALLVRSRGRASRLERDDQIWLRPVTARQRRGTRQLNQESKPGEPSRKTGSL